MQRGRVSIAIRACRDCSEIAHLVVGELLHLMVDSTSTQARASACSFEQAREMTNSNCLCPGQVSSAAQRDGTSCPSNPT